MSTSALRSSKSGFGRETAFETLEHYTQTKSLFVNTADKPIGLY